MFSYAETAFVRRKQLLHSFVVQEYTDEELGVCDNLF